MLGCPITLGLAWSWGVECDDRDRAGCHTLRRYSITSAGPFSARKRPRCQTLISDPASNTRGHHLLPEDQSGRVGPACLRGRSDA